MQAVRSLRSPDAAIAAPLLQALSVARFGVLIRPEQPNDHRAVFGLNVAAFDSASEAKLVDRLRNECEVFISLVAIDDQNIMGHIFFSPVILVSDDKAKIFGLGPMAVAPVHQRQGVGSALLRTGLDQCRKIGGKAVVVLGHPDFYPRFGFVPASQFGIGSDFPAPDEAFMALELKPGALHGKSGQVKYHQAFSDA